MTGYQIEQDFSSQAEDLLTGGLCTDVWIAQWLL